MPTGKDQPQEILFTDGISGFHQYQMEPTPHLTAVGKHFCDLTGFLPEEFINVVENQKKNTRISKESEPSRNFPFPESVEEEIRIEDSYLKVLHPEDLKKYQEFLQEFIQKEQIESLEYRILCKNGEMRYVRDTFCSQRGKDGVLYGISTLCDITDLKKEEENFHIFQEHIPVGFLKFTCEKNPKITYASPQMKKMMGISRQLQGEIDYQQLYYENIFLMIPMEERPQFANLLKKAYQEKVPVCGEIPMICCHGKRITLFGWIQKTTNSQGKEEFLSVCMDVTEKDRKKKEKESQRYLQALSEVYDKIFEFHFLNGTVKYLHGNGQDLFENIRNIPMEFEEATKQWIQSSVAMEDLEKVQKFFQEVLDNHFQQDTHRPLQIRYQGKNSQGNSQKYQGIFLKIDENRSFYCCKAIEDSMEADVLRNENESLKNRNENIQEMMMRFTEGIMAFEISGDGKYVTPMYASENVCKFFGYTEEEWLPMTKEKIKVSDFVSKSKVEYREFAELLETGEREFTYYDTKTGKDRKLKAICSEKNAQGSSPRYVMLYHIEKEEKVENTSLVEIRTFGYFDVFIKNRPIPFRNKKSKELLALLVDRRGGYITSEEAIGFLWEDEPASSVTLARYRKVALRLKNILEEYGIADIIEVTDGKRRLVTDKTNCDLYNYLSGAEEYAGLFKGSYLSNYTWGEITLGELVNEKMDF